MVDHLVLLLHINHMVDYQEDHHKDKVDIIMLVHIWLNLDCKVEECLIMEVGYNKDLLIMDLDIKDHIQIDLVDIIRECIDRHHQ